MIDNTEIKSPLTTIKKVRDVLSESKEIIAILINVVTAIIAFDVSNNKQGFEYDNFPMIIEMLNIITLFIALIMLSRKYNLKVDAKETVNGSKSELDELMTLEQTETHIQNQTEIKKIVLSKIQRINKIVAQLINAHKGFAVFLIFLYSLLFVYDSNHKNDINNRKLYELSLKDSLNKYTNYLSSQDSLNKLYFFTLKNLSFEKSVSDTSGSQRIIADTVIINRISISKDSVNKSILAKLDSLKNSADSLKRIDATMSDKLLKKTSLIELFLENDISNKPIISRIIVILFDNFFNILSASFLFIAFYVLFYKTLEKDNITQKINYLLAFAIAGAIFLFIALTITLGFKEQSLQVIIIVSRILSGLFNGVAMALLFSRFISMEYFFKNSNKWAKYYYRIGTVVILPLYAVVQPLWGLFETNYAGDQDILKTLVLLICLWGKIFFFLMVYSMLKNRWLHAYLFTLKYSEKRIKEISDKIYSVQQFAEEDDDE